MNMEQFRKLGVIEPMLEALKEEGLDKPTKIQEKSIPPVTEGKDVIAGSATGSGKTLAFGAGIIKYCEQGKGIQALVLAPTRELAQQVSKALEGFSRHKPLSIVSIFGGVAINPQMEKLKEADVVVGTPGRILDHMNRQTIDLSGVKFLVLDEADRMLDMGFIDDVQKIVDHCPSERQTVFFSATITWEVEKLSEKYMHDPVQVFAERQVDPRKLTHTYYDVDDRKKFSTLVHILKQDNAPLAMVFCNTRENTDFVANNLKANGLNALAIHGGFTQDKRDRTMKDFHSKDIQVLVCTDVAARGLDIEGVTHVYNYDIPKDVKDYIHRAGRTARAGEKGKVVNILTTRDWGIFRRIIIDTHIDMIKEETSPPPRARIDWKNPPRSFGRGRGPPGRGPPRRDGPRGRDPPRGRDGPPRRDSGGSRPRRDSSRPQRRDSRRRD